MTVVEIAERKGRARALVFLVFAAASLSVLVWSFGDRGSDFTRGLWVGVTMGSAMNLLPLGRWLKPNSAVGRLLDDETTRLHRGISGLAGFWAAVVSGIGMSFITADGSTIAPFDVTRIIATAAVGVALVSFAVLELRAARD